MVPGSPLALRAAASAYGTAVCDGVCVGVCVEVGEALDPGEGELDGVDP